MCLQLSWVLNIIGNKTVSFMPSVSLYLKYSYSFLPPSFFGMERNVPKKFNTFSQIQRVLMKKEIL